MNKFFILCSMFAATIGYSVLTTAQTVVPGENGATYFHRCGNIEYEEYLRSKDPLYDIKKQETQNSIAKKVQEMEMARQGGNPTPLTQYTIPVVFHVVYNSGNAAAENLSDQQVLNAFTQLNLDWSRANSDASNTPATWQPIAVDMQLRYCLASKDPSGNPTTGIIHKATASTSFTTDDKVKSSASGGDDAWDTHKYLNIWICNLGGGLLGYGAFLPVTNTWGTVVHYITIGSLTHPNPAGGVYGYGRTLSHEIGHCFNLYHIWGNVNSGCSGNSDAISDTPSMDGATSGCPSGVVTSSGCAAGADGSPASNVAPGRMYQNYMDYTDDMCYNMFTAGQRTEVQSAIQNYLTTVVNNSNTACTAAAALDASIAGITSPNGNFCSSTVDPVAQLQNFGTTTLTSCNINYLLDANTVSTYNWTGTLSPFQTTNVTLPTMPTPVGSHTFTVYSSDPNGLTDGNSSNDQMQSLLNVMSSTASKQTPYTEGFESSGFPYSDCYLTSTTTAQWNTTSIASATGVSSMMFDNFSQTSAGVYEFITPAIDMSNVINPSMTFQLAHAQLNSTDADKLIVFTSTNCGTTWSQRYSKIGGSLANAGIVSTAFTPSSSQWRLETVSIPNVIGQADTRLKFQFTSKGAGNNIFIDDINISDINGVNEEFTAGFNLDVFPNPFNDNTTISFNILEKYSVSIGVYDIVGREVFSVSPKKEISAGRYSLPLNRNALKSGIYFVKLNVNGCSVMKKVIIQ